MPRLKVIIEWDKPDEEYWLNVFNLHLILRQYCKNTNFKVTDLETRAKCKDGWKEKGE